MKKQVIQTEEENEKQKAKRLNQEMAVITYIFLFLFIFMAGYIVYFVIRDSDQILNNSYNKRQDLLAKRVEKGSILSADGEVLAETVTDEDGKEYRNYPYDGLFAHVVGRTDFGKNGLEATEGYTMVTTGINPVLGMLNQLQGKKNPGNNVVTTLNARLSKIASEALGSNRGSVVVIDPETGKILTMVNNPTYNPNHLTEKKWKSLSADTGSKSALYNRATQGLYPPGSTFKLYTALEYIRENENYNSFRHICTGSVGSDEDKISCYGGEVHNEVDLEEAFAESCNTAFCTIGESLNVKAWNSLCRSLYFNQNAPLTKLAQNASQFEVTEDTSEGDLRQVSIGQGNVLVTPLQNAFLVCAAVNGGKLMTPYVVDKIEDFEGNVIKETEPSVAKEPISKSEARALKKLMRATVTSGTAQALNTSNYKAGGKTGSAEFQNNSTDSHAWFIGYAQKGGQKLVVSIVVEAAGTGSAYAVPIAKKIFDAYW